MNPVREMARDVGHAAGTTLVGEVVTRLTSWLKGLVRRAKDALARARGTRSPQPGVATITAGPSRPRPHASLRGRMQAALLQLRLHTQDMLVMGAMAALEALDVERLVKVTVAALAARIPMLRFLTATTPLRI